MNINQILGLRIKEARKMVGLSQQELGEALGFDHPQIVSQIENGERQVKAWELSKLASVLHVSISKLLQEDSLRAPVVLWREEPQNNIQRIESEFVQDAHNYDVIEKLSGVKPGAQLRSSDIPGIRFGFDEAADLARQVGTTMNLGSAPATSLTKVLEEDFGVKIFYHENLEGSAASAVGDFGHAILMNSSEAPWRRNYNFAHELFHLLTWEVMPPEKLRADPSLKEKFEKLANYFASCLLLPADSVLAVFSNRVKDKKISYADLMDIAQEFDVSTEALLWRLVNLRRIVADDVKRVLIDPAFRKLAKSAMSGRWWQPEALSSRYVRLCFLSFQKGQLSRARLAELLRISLADLRENVNALDQQTSEAALSIA
jgi:Zn-dependent peptidase ImmA (M78 family)/transcriptional regulator with XRE-family HTH domain